MLMQIQKIILEKYLPKGGETYYFYRTFGGKVVAFPYKVFSGEYIISYTWPEQQMSASQEDVLQSQ